LAYHQAIITLSLSLSQDIRVCLKNSPKTRSIW